MLILGIETATVKAAVASHGRPRGRARSSHSGALSATLRTPPGRSSSPAVRPASSLGEIGLVAVDAGPGLFTGLVRRSGDGQGDRASASGSR